MTNEERIERLKKTLDNTREMRAKCLESLRDLEEFEQEVLHAINEAESNPKTPVWKIQTVFVFHKYLSYCNEVNRKNRHYIKCASGLEPHAIYFATEEEAKAVAEVWTNNFVSEQNRAKGYVKVMKDEGVFLEDLAEKDLLLERQHYKCYVNPATFDPWVNGKDD